MSQREGYLLGCTSASPGGVVIHRSVLLLLALTALAPVAHSEAAPALPAWLDEIARARGIDAAPQEYVVLRTIRHADGVETTVVPLSELPAELPEARAAGTGMPAIVVGELLMHTMFQYGHCAGYGLEPIGHGLSRIEGASWDLGVHAVAVAPPHTVGVDTASPGDLEPAQFDSGIREAIGDITTTESRILVSGVCLVLTGTMVGTGVWHFS